jgi:hypothetical protein
MRGIEAVPGRTRNENDEFVAHKNLASARAVHAERADGSGKTKTDLQFQKSNKT